MKQRDDISNDIQTLKGVAIGPAMSMAVAQMVEEQVSDECANRVIDALGSTLSSSSTGLGALELLGRVLAIALAAAVVVGSTIVAFQLLSSDEPIQNALVTEYNPQAHIEFVGSTASDGVINEANEHIDPTEARLVLSEGFAVGWTITDHNGTELAGGSGSTVTDAFAGFAPGMYTLTWTAEDEQGNQVFIKRDFLIS